MSSVQKRSNGKWRARYRDAEGSEHSRHFPRRVDALAWLRKVESSIERGDYVDPHTAKMTVSQWCDSWVVGYSTRRESTVKQAKVHLRVICAYFGPMRLSSVKPSDVKAWTVKLQGEGLSESYIYALHRRLSQVLGDAVHDGIIPRNPCSRRTSPKSASARPYVATTGQVWALHDAFPEHLRAAVLLGAFAGLRVSEAAALRPSDVDFMRGIITPEIQHGGLPLKSAMSYTPIPIPQDLSLMLSAAASLGEGRTIVTNEIGRESSPWAIERAMRRVRGEVEGLPESFRHHDLRHYYASLLISSGLDVKVVQTRMRHASAMTTLNTYGHIWPDTDESARAAVSNAMASRADCVRTSESG